MNLAFHLKGHLILFQEDCRPSSGPTWRSSCSWSEELSGYLPLVRDMIMSLSSKFKTRVTNQSLFSFQCDRWLHVDGRALLRVHRQRERAREPAGQRDGLLQGAPLRRHAHLSKPHSRYPYHLKLKLLIYMCLAQARWKPICHGPGLSLACSSATSGIGVLIR